MAQSRALLLLLLLPPQLHLGPVMAVRPLGFGRSGAHSPSPEENEFVEEEPVLVLSPEEPRPGPATIDCPRDCACSQEGVVDCGGIDLREFPGDLPEHTNHLSLQNNQLEKIYPEELSRLQWLETLNLQNNRLTSRGLPEEAFEHLTNLNYLYLANNKLTLAPRFLPNALISVDFAANYLTKIYGLTFGQKPNLRSVYLHNNKLADAGLPDSMFNGSSNVEILILSSNFLRHVPKHLPPALYKLHLKNNKLEKIPPGAFSELSNLRELYLQNNYLTDQGLDNETFWKLSSLEYLDLSSNNLSRVPVGLPRSLVLLHLEKNIIQRVDADVLTPIRSLEYLLLHSNQLRADGIHPLAFQGLKRLHTVHLYNNALERVPSGLPRRVRTLMILHNQITGIGREDFATTYFLEELNLSYNRITSPQVHRDAFRKLRLLRSLDLSGNRLHILPPGLPRNVHVLKVKRNELAALARGALAGMAQLRELYLTSNHLWSRALAPRAWSDLAHLQLLDIAGNQLTEIPEGLPESLEYLYLQNNKISTVPANAFDSTPNLKGIFLRFNKLAVGSVVESAFRRLKHLQVLDIEGNIEFGDTSKGRGHLEKEEEEEEEEEEEDEEETR
ncbi:podocan isoform X1 [Heterocephalus glaber]|uniref:Podocan n=1 Tax=Heterocephalus glaber TaxID=10181 RepID=A0AAX6S388_HETGA|nr:podocan isoform X1 [Heterocephalus glaber]XP_012922706.1 podocan isoform X1 [Heterocephalus glaber]XP_012922708.1 podocan isoform X1 [Heterocephalus glaber]XP_021103665.1 podocan isoform X1 [Heterocephalus glaber]